MVKPLLRMTRQRRVILEELRHTRSHPTADELFERVRKRLPRISLGTVYRNLDLLSKCGIIQKVRAIGAQTRYDGDTTDHSHICCVQCGRLDDIPGALPVTVQAPVAGFADYEVLGHRVEFLGVCPPCQREAGQDTGHGGP